METNYTWEKLFECMHMFASSGSIQDRLYHVYAYLSRLREEDFPEPLLRELKEINQTIEEYFTNENRLSRMSDEEASKVAKKIVDLYDKVSRRRGIFDFQENPEMYDYIKDIVN